MADIELVFGVKGGGKLNGDSGKEIKASLDQLVKNLKAAKTPEIKLFFTYDAKDITSLSKKIQREFKNNKVKLDIGTSGSNGASTTKDIKAQTDAVAQQNAKYKELQQSIKDAYNAQNKAYSKNNLAEGQKYSDYYQQYANQVEQVNTLLRETDDKLISQEQRQQLINQAKELQLRNETTLAEKYTVQDRNVGKIKDKVGEWVKRTEELGVKSETLKQLFEQIHDLIDKGYDKTGGYEERLANAKDYYAQISDLENKAKQEATTTGAVGKNVFAEAASTLQNRFAQAISGSIVAITTKGLKSIYQNIVDINTAMTQLEIVTQSTSSTYTKFLEDATDAAKELGVAIDDLIESTTTFARLGFSLEDSEVFAELTAMYSNITGISVDDATTNLTAIIKAYNVAADEAEAVLDKLIQVGNNYAISSSELGEAMNNAASILASNGNSLEEAFGLLAAANATLQDVSKSSTAIRTITARISASTAELEELGEDTTNLTTTADLQRSMSAFGVSVTDANGELRSTYDILNDLAGVWDTLTSVEQAAIADMLAGTRQQTAFYSIMENWEDATGAVEDCETATGLLADSYDTYLDSIEGKLNQLSATWESISQSLLDSSLVTGLLDIVNGLASALDWLTSTLNGFGGNITLVATVLVTIAALYGAFKDKIVKYSKTIGTSLKSTFTSGYTYIALLIAAMMSAEDATSLWITFGVSVVAVIAGIVAAIKAAETSNIIGWILLAITGAVTAIMSLIKLFTPASYSDLKEAAQDAIDAWNEATDAVEETKSEIEELEEELEALNAIENPTLADEAQTKELEKQIALLKEELLLEEETAAQAEKDAASAALKAVDKLSSGMSLAGAVTLETAVNGEVDWSTMWDSLSESDQTAFTDYIKEYQDLFSEFSYFTGDDLEPWQKAINEQLDNYYRLLDVYSLSQGNIDTAWDSITSRDKYSDAIRALTDLANKGMVSVETLQELYNSDEDVQEFMDYLSELGLLALDDADSMDAFTISVREWATTVSSVVSESALDILDSIGETYDILSTALSEMAESGIISSDTIQELYEDFPTIASMLEEEGLLQQTEDGYTLDEQAMDAWKEYKRDAYLESIEDAQEYYEQVLEMFENGYATQEDVDAANESLQNAISNFENYVTAINTLERSDLIEEYTEMLEEQSDALEDQYDKYKELVDIRKDLLESYEEEVDYQKELASKQKSVADLETQLAIAKLDTSAAGQARVRELQSELDEAQEELDDYTLEHAIDTLTEQLDNELDEYESFIDEQTQALEDAINNAASMTTNAIREALGYETTSTTNVDGTTSDSTGSYHTGGLVGSYAKLQNNEVFAKLLQGEYVATPKQMSNFIDEMLPNIVNTANSGSSAIVYNSPLITITGNEISKDTMPQLEKLVDKAVQKVRNEINATITRTGRSSSSGTI